MRTGRVRSIVKTGRGNRHGKAIEATTFLIEFVADVDQLLTLCVAYGDGRHGLKLAAHKVYAKTGTVMLDYEVARK